MTLMPARSGLYYLPAFDQRYYGVSVMAHAGSFYLGKKPTLMSVKKSSIGFDRNNKKLSTTKDAESTEKNNFFANNGRVGTLFLPTLQLPVNGQKC